MLAWAEEGAFPSTDGVLSDLPVAVKDNICTADFPTTCGSRLLEGYRSPFDATAVERLRNAGATIVGKTNLDEFAMGSSTEHSAFGPTRHPHHRDRVPGGSSGGSAAIVAAGALPVALGSDTGGSVRQPAAFCGVLGIKPTYGRVSRYGLVAFASSLDQIGVISRTAEHAARVLAVISGRDDRDPTSAAAEAFAMPAWSEALEGLTVGVPVEYVEAIETPGVRARIDATIARLRDLGAVVQSVSLPHTSIALSVYYLVASAEAASNLARFDGVRFGRRADGASADEVIRRSRSEGFGDEVQRRILTGTHVLSAEGRASFYDRARRARLRVTRDFHEAFRRCDALFTPTTPTTAFRLAEYRDDPVSMYRADVFTVPASLAGLPAQSVPVGVADGLPVGGQFIAPPFEEARLLQIAHALEQSAIGREAS